ncbi:Cof-type HAD-IIB family hydrolase [Dellaglioa sp. P0083]|uniref:Cof-type HAD-IIB family hydrolase n=1 Tax=Dellaglioa kimchii TaxID=3344667 RepID=UPI0038D5115E
MIKIIASDMDGTLLNNENSISKGNAAAIKKAQEMGVTFVVATGRSYDEVKPLIDAAGISAPMINYNGGATVTEEGKQINSFPISKKEAQKLIKFLKNEHAFFKVMTSKGVYSDDYSEIIDDSEIDLFKFLIRKTDESDDLSVLKNKIEENETLIVTSSGDNNLEVNHVNAQKGIALKNFADSMGIPMSEVMAIGDNLNDISMLKAAGISYAMENGHQINKDISNHYAKKNDEDGVGLAILEQLVKN